MLAPCKMLAAAAVIALVAVPACDAWATGPAAVFSRTACGPFKAGARSLAPQRQATALGLVMAEPKVVGLIGATGGVGRLCCAALLEQGVSVRAIVRDVQKAKGLLPADCEQSAIAPAPAPATRPSRESCPGKQSDWTT